MPLDPKAKEFLDTINAAGLPPFDALPIDELRQLTNGMMTMRAVPEPIAQVDSKHIAGPAGAVPVRLYRPEHKASLPVVVFFHGGGWVIGNLDSHDALCRALANAVPAIVVAVDYRLAPEHPFPAAADDAYAAVAWAGDHAAEIGGDPRRLVVCGDSAGGNLSAVAALMARDRGGPALAYQVLVYPVTEANFDTPSYRENANGYFLTQDMMRWFWDQYAPGPVARQHAYAAPLRAADFRGLPPALVITAELDPLRDEGEAYAERLRAAGVAVQLRRYDGMFHGFFTMLELFEQARAAINDIAVALDRL